MSKSPYSKAKILHPLKREKEISQDITDCRMTDVSAGNVFRLSVIWRDRPQKKLPQPRTERSNNVPAATHSLQVARLKTTVSTNIEEHPQQPEAERLTLTEKY